MKEKDESSPKKKDRKAIIDWWQSMIKNSQEFTGILVAPVLLGAAFGWWLDKKFMTEPIFLLTFILVGFILSIVSLYRKIKN